MERKQRMDQFVLQYLVSILSHTLHSITSGYTCPNVKIRLRVSAIRYIDASGICVATHRQSILFSTCGSESKRKYYALIHWSFFKKRQNNTRVPPTSSDLYRWSAALVWIIKQRHHSSCDGMEHRFCHPRRSKSDLVTTILLGCVVANKGN